MFYFLIPSFSFLLYPKRYILFIRQEHASEWGFSLSYFCENLHRLTQNKLNEFSNQYYQLSQIHFFCEVGFLFSWVSLVVTWDAHVLSL